ncbi:MAG TPA: Ig-like domain-containing protein [Anaeromyxobacteraceae bacterium]|jgi:hypothetical protein
MTTRALTAATVALFSTFVLGCGKSSKAGPVASSLAVTATPATVLANGTNTVAVHVAGGASGSISVTTNRGTFPGGSKSATLTGPGGDLVLTTCNIAVDASCAGVAVVAAIDSTLTQASASATFGGFELCTSNCAFDAACVSHACTTGAGGSGTCSAGTPSACVAPACTPSPAGAITETSCSDGIDNDCSTKIDCVDRPACDGQACKAGSPTFLCQAGACTDVSSGTALEVTPARTRLPANGAATTPVVLRVTKDGAPQAGVGIALATTLGSLSAASATTGADGTATVTFTASATAGAAAVTASLTAVPVISQSAIVTMPALGQIVLGAPIAYPVMGVRGSGYREINLVTVAVQDDAGLSYPDGLAVRFEHQRLGGSALSAPPTPDTATCVAAAGCVGFLGVTDASGVAGFNLFSGTLAGTLSVSVSATAGGQTRTFNVPNVAVIGARASGGNLSIVCSPRNVPALAETDCHTSLVDAQITCEARLKDRFNNLLGTSTQVTFVSEAAAVGQVSTTPAYDPTKDPASQSNLGVARQIFETLGAGLPANVSPDPGEPQVSDPSDLCGWTVHHPRNGLVTLAAIADGEEAFDDLNGNGVYDAGEPFIDLGEPFVDENDDGQHQVGEWFLDVNGNGLYDPANGTWDAATKIWTETRVVYTGAPAGPFPAAPPFLGTRWANSLASACTATAAASFAVNAQQVGPPPVPATSQVLFVVASDLNLNQLAESTSYAVAVEPGSLVTATYGGRPAYADDLGLFFRYQVCDRNGVNCSDRCLASGATLPCLMKPSIPVYSCGLATFVTITGGTTAGGTNVVDWKVGTTYSVFGGEKTAENVVGVAGANN